MQKSPQFWLRIIIVVQLALLAFEFSPDISTNGDDAKYFLLGKALTSGNGYHVQYDPQNPVEKQYPPLFPAFLGAASVFANTPLIPKIAVGIISAAVLLLLFYYLRFSVPSILLPLLLITALSASLASHATLLMSELPYLFAMLAALLLMEKSRLHPQKGILFWAAAVVSVCPVLIRTTGLAFTAAWILVSILDKRYKQAAVHALLFICAMVLLRVVTGWDNPYIDQLFRKNQYDPELGFVTVAQMFARIGENMQIYFFTVFPQSVFGIEIRKSSAVLVSLLLTIPALIGWIRNFFLPTRILSCYLVFYCGIICMWQTQWSGERFAIPIVPFLSLFFLLGLETVFVWCAGKIFRGRGATQDSTAVRGAVAGTLWAVTTLIVLFNVTDRVRSFSVNAELTKDWKNFYSCADWIRLNTPDDAIVVSRKPELVYLRAGRKGFVYPFSHDVEKVIDGLKKGNTRYIILDNFAWSNTTVRYLFPAIMSHQENFRVVYALQNPDTYVLEFVTRR